MKPKNVIFSNGVHNEYSDILEQKLWYDVSYANQWLCLKKYIGTSLEKYIEKAGQILDEHIKNAGIQSISMEIKYADGNVKFLESVYLLPNWHNDNGENKYKYVAYCITGDSTFSKQLRNFFTIEYNDRIEFKLKQLYNKDRRYRKIVDVAISLCQDMQYDWSKLNTYTGAPPQLDPNKKHTVCVGYATEARNEFSKLEYVIKVYTCNGKNHMWNMLELDDGRKLYVDLTWFNNETIDPKTGIIKRLYDYKWDNITFDEEIFRYSGIAYGTGECTHNLNYSVR